MKRVRERVQGGYDLYAVIFDSLPPTVIVRSVETVF